MQLQLQVASCMHLLVFVCILVVPHVCEWNEFSSFVCYRYVVCWSRPVSHNSADSSGILYCITLGQCVLLFCYCMHHIYALQLFFAYISLFRIIYLILSFRIVSILKPAWINDNNNNKSEKNKKKLTIFIADSWAYTYLLWNCMSSIHQAI